MKLTVLGKYGSFPAPGGACSGYILESGGIRLVLDLGSGTFSRLIQFLPDLKVNAVLLSHLHSDHMSDMLIMRYALAQLRSRDDMVSLPMPVVMPAEPNMEFRQLAASGVYDITTIRNNMRIHIGDMSIKFHKMKHTVESYAFEIEHRQRRFIYTGDTGWSDDLVRIARDCDMLLADTGYLTADKTSGIAPHLTAREAGELARTANVKKLICTHIWGGGYTDKQILDEARIAFPKAVVAEEMKTYAVYNIGTYGV